MHTRVQLSNFLLDEVTGGHPPRKMILPQSGSSRMELLIRGHILSDRLPVNGFNPEKR